MNQNAYLVEGEQLVRKHSRLISAVDKALKENANYGKGLDQYRKVSLAQMLENTSNAFDLQKKMNEAAGVQTTDVAGKNDYLNMITAIMPSLVAEDIVSVQPLKQKAGVVFYLKTTYGDTKGGITAGDTISEIDRVWANDTVAAANYSAEDVEDEETVVTSGAFNLSWTPIIPKSVSFKVGSNTYTDNGAGKIVQGTTEKGTINYATGAVALTTTTEAPVDNLVSYKHDLTTSPVNNVPSIGVKVTDLTLTARPRKLQAIFGMDAAFDLMATQNVDMQSLLQETTTNEIRSEIDAEILNDLANSGTDMTISWNMPVPFGISKVQHYDSFYNTVIAASNKIFQKTRRVSGNILIVGENGANVVETHEKFKAAPSMNEAGPHIMGTLNNKFIVVKNPYYNSDAFTVLYKGDIPFDCAYVYAPYMPLMSTQFIMGADFKGSRGYATSYAKKLITNKFFVQGSITHTED